MFVEYLARMATSRSGKDKRKTVTYKDLANAVSEELRLHFLQDIVPKTMPLNEALQLQRKRAMEMVDEDDDVTVAGTTTGSVVSKEVESGTNMEDGGEGADADEDREEMPLELSRNPSIAHDIGDTNTTVTGHNDNLHD